MSFSVLTIYFNKKKKDGSLPISISSHSFAILSYKIVLLNILQFLKWVMFSCSQALSTLFPQITFSLGWLVLVNPMNVRVNYVTFPRKLPLTSELGWQLMLGTTLAFYTMKEYSSLYMFANLIVFIFYHHFLKEQEYMI